jgi:peptide deformylase
MIRETLVQAYETAVAQEAPRAASSIGEISPLGLVYFPDDVLKKVCAPVVEVTEEIKQLARDMILTMMLEGGVGLAAPQVGKLIQMFVVDIQYPEDLDRADPHIFINPEIEIVEGSERILRAEGCLSFPGGRARVERYQSIRVKHLDGDGNPTVTEADDFLARVIQHERDHLDGVTIQGSISSFDMMTVRKNIQAKMRSRKREANPQRHPKNGRKRS